MKGKAINTDIIASVVQNVCATYNITTEQFKSQSGDSTLPRRLTAYLLKKEFDQPLRAIRTALNVKSDMVAYTSCKYIESLLQKDQELRSSIQRIKTDVLTACVESIGPGVQAQPSPRKEVVGPKAEEIDSGALIQLVLTHVGKVYLSPALLTNPKACAQIDEARELSVFILWKYYRIQLPELESIFSLDVDGCFLAIGRISVYVEQDKELSQNLQKIRKELKV